MFSAADAVRNDMITELLQKRQEHDIRELNSALNEFRFLHQQPSQRREWDLYDPDHLKKDKPARVSDDDPRCGVSGLQMFVGRLLTPLFCYVSSEGYSGSCLWSEANTSCPAVTGSTFFAMCLIQI